MHGIASFPLHARLVRSQKEGLHAGHPEAVASILKELSLQWKESWIEQPAFIQNSDQIAAVLRSPRHAFDFSVAINLAAWPLQYQVSVGSMDMKMAHVSKLRKTPKQLFTMQLRGFPLALQELIESSARLHADIMYDWKPSRAAAATTMRKTETQHAAAEALGIRQQSVSEALRAAHAKDLVSLEDAIRTCLTTPST